MLQSHLLDHSGAGVDGEVVPVGVRGARLQLVLHLQYSTVQYSTVQCSTVQYSTAQLVLHLGPEAVLVHCVHCVRGDVQHGPRVLGVIGTRVVNKVPGK